MRKKRAAMEGGERSNPHRTRSSGSGAGEFFICFTARTSSSSATPSASGSMRATSSKSLMSPGRGHDPSPAPPLSASFSRRLRRNGSFKGGQSPMFPAGVALTGRKKGCTFEPAEPSSPKVTCIGQVRVKAKKRVKSKVMARSRSQRWRARNNNQGGWVHQLPVSICEALRSIGSEFNCFLPCGGRSLCGGGSNSSSRTGEEKRSGKKGMARSASSSSCSAVVARWLMAVQEREEEAKGGDLVGLVVEEREKVEVGFLLREREEHVGEVEVEEKREMVVVGEKGEGGEEESARVSVCIPPRNALLLMRCRSDPVKMAALANRFWGSPAAKLHCEEEHVKEEDNEEEKEVEEDCEKSFLEKEGDEAVEVSLVAGELVKEEFDCERTAGEEKKTLMEDGDVSDEEEKLQLLREEVGTAIEGISCESPPVLRRNSSKDEGNGETKGTHLLKEQEREEEKAEKETKGCRVKEERRSGSICAYRSKERGWRRGKEKDSRRHSFSSEMEARRHSFSLEREARRASFSIDRGRRWSFSMDKEESGPKEEALTVSAAEASPEDEKKKEVTPEEEEEEEEVEASGETESEKPKCREEQQANGQGEHEAEEEKKREAGKWTELPDCLVMMMYEPKLSMEVSKETWVCSNDFLRSRSHHTRNRRPSEPEAAAAGSEAAECRTKEDGDDNAASAVQIPLPTAAAAEEATPQDAPAVVLVDPMAVPLRVPAIQQHKVSAGTARQAAVVPYEPLVLTRCKSEPVRSSASLAPDASFWKDRHRPIGAAGIGF